VKRKKLFVSFAITNKQITIQPFIRMLVFPNCVRAYLEQGRGSKRIFCIWIKSKNVKCLVYHHASVCTPYWYPCDGIDEQRFPKIAAKIKGLYKKFQFSILNLDQRAKLSCRLYVDPCIGRPCAKKNDMREISSFLLLVMFCKGKSEYLIKRDCAFPFLLPQPNQTA
jgi:hypothetical protein